MSKLRHSPINCTASFPEVRLARIVSEGLRRGALTEALRRCDVFGERRLQHKAVTRRGHLRICLAADSESCDEPTDINYMLDKLLGRDLFFVDTNKSIHD